MRPAVDINITLWTQTYQLTVQLSYRDIQPFLLQTCVTWSVAARFQPQNKPIRPSPASCAAH